MPGLAVADILAKVFQLATDGESVRAYEVFQGVLPQIVFSLHGAWAAEDPCAKEAATTPWRGR